jgi:DNA modification methylase
MSEIEDAVVFGPGTDGDGAPLDFTKFLPRRQERDARPVPHVFDIVSVSGDTRRGRKPFPHPFPARMPIEVAEAAVKAISIPGEVVLDPMAGSGVVPKAALLAGRKAVGFDIDPLAVAQSRALCAKILSSDLEAICCEVVQRAKLVAGKELLSVWEGLDEEEERFIDYWFDRTHANQLFALSLAIDQFAKRDEWPVLATLFSSLIIARDSGSSRALDLSRSRPHRVDSKVVRAPFELWHRQVVAFQRYYDASQIAGRAEIGLGDARDLDIEDDSIDAVITSPPYLNAIDYLRTSKFSLLFLGSKLKDLRKVRARSIGTEVGLAAGHLPGALEDMVEKGVADSKRRPLVRRYMLDLRDALAEAYRVLKPGRQAIFVMGPSILSRREYDAARVLGAVARSVGFRPTGDGRRDILQARRSLPPPKRSERGLDINKRMTCEFYVALMKDDE